MSAPRVRMVAGPNGSGKTTLIQHLRKTVTIFWGHHLNPDDLDQELSQTGKIDLGRWGVTIVPQELEAFVGSHPLARRAALGAVRVEGNIIRLESKVSGSYLASILSDYLRRQWLDQRATFTFETVMSGNDKIKFLSEARALGYRNYLYYICTDTPLINQRRVANRVLEGGHDVPAEKILTRYDRSLGMLPEAILRSTRAYLFDNSGESHRLIAEFDSGNLVQRWEPLPLWATDAILRVEGMK